METIAGMTVTGRTFPGPAADLVELDSDSGLKHTAICFHPEHRSDSALGAAMHDVGGFLEAPNVTGLVPLKRFARHEGAFIYPTGSVWSVAQIVRLFALDQRKCGLRAGLEFAYVVSQVLLEASEVGGLHGIHAHGGLTPWRVMLKNDGQASVVGYGVPQVQLLAVVDSKGIGGLTADSFRYAPPERLAGEPEDLSSDLFSLSLIALEIITGRPVYQGTAEDVRFQAARAEGARRLYQWRHRLPEGVREVFGRALRYDRDSRHHDPEEFVYAVHEELSLPGVDGVGMMALMSEVPALYSQYRKVSREPDPLPEDDVDEDSDVEEVPVSEPEDDGPGPRWVSRGGRRRGRSLDADEERISRRSEPDEDEPGRVRRGSAGARRNRTEAPRRAGERPTRRAGGRRARPPEPEVEPELPEPEEPDERPRRARPSRVAELEVEAEPKKTSTADLISRLSRAGERAAPPKPEVADDDHVGVSDGTTILACKAVIGTGRAVNVAVDPADSIAATTWKIMHQMDVLTTDLFGRVAGAYRIEQGGKEWGGATSSVVIDPAKRIQLEWVANEQMLVTFQIDDGDVIQFMAPVGLTIPVFALVNHFKDWLGLSEGEWEMCLEGEALDPHQMLYEFDGRDDLVFEVRR